jgi:hypothetical protein
MIPKSGHRFSDKIMRNEEIMIAKAGTGFRNRSCAKENSSSFRKPRSGYPESMNTEQEGRLQPDIVSTAVMDSGSRHSASKTRVNALMARPE